MKKTLLLIAVLFTFAANAHPVGEKQAYRVAARFWNLHRPAGMAPAANLATVHFDGLDHLTIVNINGAGFVIVAGDDRVMPVLGYSFDGAFPAELNPETGYWLRGYEQQLASLAKSDATASDDLADQWGALLADGDDPEPDTTQLQRIPAMLETRWDQTAPYNYYCPYDSAASTRTLVGCVATAMAQIMKYWNYPYVGEGSLSYRPYPYEEISVDFGNSTYLWHIMSNSSFIGNHGCRDMAAALISYHCGVAVKMEYGPTGSGAYSSCFHEDDVCATSAFIDHFKYNPDLYHAYRMGHSDSVWKSLINADLAAGRPIYYSGHDSTGGHAFILDGVDIHGRYHVNWGWGGSCDGHYAIDDLAPRSGGAGSNATHTFNQSQGAIFGIFPRETETFDTVDYYDTVCANDTYAHFHDYDIAVEALGHGEDTLLHQLDTVYRYHVSTIPQKRVKLVANNGTNDNEVLSFCPVRGFVFPECEYEKDGSVFFAWCRTRDGSGEIYYPGETLFTTRELSFYALWVDTTNVGIGESSTLNSQLSIYPNPTTGELTVTVPTETGAILVTDMLGRVVLRDDHPNLMGGHAKISLGRLPDGTYNVQVKTAKGIYNQRVIKR